MTAGTNSLLERTISLGEHGDINGLWHCFGVRSEKVDWRLAARMLDASGTALLPVNTDKGRPLIGHGDVYWDNFRHEASRRNLVACLNINLQTSAARAVAQAVKFRDLTGISLLKLEVLSKWDDSQSNDDAVVEATRVLVDDGFTVMPLISASLQHAYEVLLPDVPVLRVMGSPIGSGLGIVDPDMVEAICLYSDVPVVLDGGVGTIDHGRHALDLGCAGFLVNSALFTPGQLDPAERLAMYRQAFA